MRTLIFDTETTGLTIPSIANLNKQPYVIEYYGTVDDEEIDELYSVPVPITKEITKITGITEEMVAGKPRFDARRIADQIESCDRVVAHNLSFDKQMLDIEFERAKLEVKWPELVCTVEASEHLLGYRLSLTALHEYLFGEPFKGAHRAREDVQALKRCYLKLVEMGEI